MSQQPWLDHYPSDVDSVLVDLKLPHLPALVGQASNEYANTIAFTQVMANGMNGSLRYRDVEMQSDNFAAYLREVLRLEPGDRVAVQMPNTLSYPVVAFGIIKAGLVLVNTNPLYTAAEMAHQFKDSGAKALVITDMFADRLPEVLPQTEIENVVTVKITEFFSPVVAGVIRLVQKVWSRTLPPITVPHTPFQEALKRGEKHCSRAQAEAYLREVKSETLALLQYTGGTTGVSKGAMLSHGNLVSNTAQLMQMNGEYILPGKEVAVTALPLYHIFAFTVNLLGFYHMGARNILIPTPRPPSNLKRAFENYKVTWMVGVNTLFSALLNERWFADSPPKHLKASAAGGMSLHESVARQWRLVTGTPIVEGFGLTESSPVLSFNPLGGMFKDNSIGIPVPSTEMACVDEKGNQLPIDQPGELIAKGPQIMQGYWQNERETKTALKDGWLYTGDIAQMDSDGYFTIVDRKKDMVLVSGFNVYPNDIEETIAAMEGILEVGVVGVPDSKSGEAVRAYVVVSAPAPSETSILAHCRKNLAAYKVPKKIVFVDELPKSPIGKILRRELRDGQISSFAETKGTES